MLGAHWQYKYSNISGEKRLRCFRGGQDLVLREGPFLESHHIFHGVEHSAHIAHFRFITYDGGNRRESKIWGWGYSLKTFGREIYLSISVLLQYKICEYLVLCDRTM